MASEAVEAGELFFRNLTQAGMTPAERTFVRIEIEARKFAAQRQRFRPRLE
jgi:hypothetical protein